MEKPVSKEANISEATETEGVSEDKVTEDVEDFLAALTKETSQADSREPAQAATEGVSEDKVTGNVEDFLAALTKETGQVKSSEFAKATEPTSAAGVVSQDVSKLLVRAQTLLAASNLVVPEARNARALYLKVLTIDPDNKAALAGMNRIGTIYEQAAKIMLEEGRGEVGRQLIIRGLDAVPNHTGLLALQARTQGQ